MNKDAQQSFDTLNELKKKQKMLKTKMKEFYFEDAAYEDAEFKIKEARQTKKAVENRINKLHMTELKEIDELQKDIAEEKEVLTNYSIIAEKKGEQLSLFDNHVTYIPKLNATFIKKI
jgi:predicted phage tail protein